MSDEFKTEPVKFYEGTSQPTTLKDWVGDGGHTQIAPNQKLTEVYAEGQKTLGALRFNAGKFMLSLVPPSLSRYVGAVLTFGAKKYAPNNWRRGFAWSSIIDSLERHLAAFKEGEDIDPESGLPHLAHIGCNVAFLIEHYDAGLGEDDRFRVAAERKKLTMREPVKA